MNIQIDNNKERILAELRNLREEFMKLLDERDELVYKICPMLEAKYASEIGKLEAEALEWESKVQLIKEKIELIRIRINHGQEVILSEIEEELSMVSDAVKEKETAENQLGIDLLSLMEEDLPEEKRQEIKKIYKAIAKKIHPDTNPDINDVEKELFFKAVEAYESADLRRLTILDTAIAVENESELAEDAPETLIKKCERLRKGIADLEHEISTLKANSAYALKPYLEDEAWVAERKERYATAVADFKDLYRAYKIELDELVKK